jgi:hypothetical protein
MSSTDEGTDRVPNSVPVTIPADLDGASMGELVQGWQDHIAALVDARHGLSEHSPGRLRGTALDALVCGAAVVQRLQYARPVTMVDALSYGATVDDVATAVGTTPGAVVDDVRAWADGQLRHDLITQDRHAVVLALLP